jgi:hypothetical protein
MDMSQTDKNPAAVALGRLGGRMTSKAKARAARANGKKGGRPRKAKQKAEERTK